MKKQREEAKEAMEDGRWDDALYVLREVCASSDATWKDYADKAECLHELGDESMAKSHVLAAVSFSPSIVRAHIAKNEKLTTYL